MSSCLESISIEVLYEIFDYLSPHELFRAFSGQTNRFNIALARYPVCLDMRFVSRYAFDYLCRMVQPEQIFSLILLDSVQSPGQVEVFLKSVRVEQMKNLRSLTLIGGETVALSSIFVRLPCTELLKSLTVLGCHTTDYTVTLTPSGEHVTDDRIHPFLRFVKTPLHHLRYLSIDSCTNDDIQQICLLVPQVESLSIKKKDDNLPKIDRLPKSLTKFTLIMSGGKFISEDNLDDKF